MNNGIIINMNTTKKILFVEDEEALQRALTDALSPLGYIIFQATDGEQGVAMAQKEIPDLVLLDLILPKKSGFEVLQELKKDPTTKNIPVIILTNLEGSEDVERALASGATTYMVKANYSVHEIVAKVESVLDHHTK